MRSLCVWYRSPILVDQFSPVYLILFLVSVPQFLFSQSRHSAHPEVVTGTFLKSGEIPFPLWLSQLVERQSMHAKAHPSTQAIGISVQLLIAWPEDIALQKYPGRKREQAGWWAGWYSKINHQNSADASINHLAQPHEWLIWSRKQRHYLIVHNTWVSESIWQRWSNNYSLQNGQICW